MCFSAEASFIGAAVLTATGVLTFRLGINRKQMMLALMPFLFAFQQLNEGWLWLFLPESSDSFAVMAAKYSFLFVALVVWPCWIPISLLIFEKKAWNKRVLAIFSGIGSFYSLQMVGYFLYWWFIKDVHVTIAGHHIQYDYQLYPYENLYGIGYLFCTLLPSFFSSHKGIKILGCFNAATFLISEYIYEVFFVSVWCFLAAWTSIGIYFVLRNEREKK